MKTLYQQLFYEGVKEEMGQSSELLYVSVENQLLSHLPYIIALDHSSRRDILPLPPLFAPVTPPTPLYFLPQQQAGYSTFASPIRALHTSNSSVLHADNTSHEIIILPLHFYTHLYLYVVKKSIIVL